MPEIVHETTIDRRDGLAFVVLEPGIRPGRYGYATARRHLLAWNGPQCASRRERLAGRRSTHSQSGSQWRYGHNYRPKHKQRRGGMFDRGDFAIGNVRIARDLRRRWNGNSKRHFDTRNRGNAGRHAIIRNIDIDGNFGDVGIVDILRNAGNVGINRNVRLRLEQRRRIVDANVNIAHHDEQPCSNRNSVGVYGGRQSRGYCRARGLNAERIAHCQRRRAGTNDADRCISVYRFIDDDRHYPVNQFSICERERS